MRSLDVSDLTNGQRSTGIWAASLLQAIARDEAAGRRTPRLTEPKLDTWSRFRGRLTSTDFITLLFEDAAILHRLPFDPSAVGGPIDPAGLPESLAEAWLASIGSLSRTGSGSDYVLDQARLLGLPSRLARSELQVVRSHQRVLELPGTGGQLAYHIVSTQGDLTIQDNFLVACNTWQELTLAGIVGLDLAAPHSDFLLRIEIEGLKDPAHPLRQRSFDFVVGLHPDKGGPFRIEDQLAIWFPTAKAILV
jgi:hypothetical protein